MVSRIAVLQALAGGVVAGGPREDEGDGGQHVRRGQVLDHLGPPGDPVAVPGIAAAPVVEGDTVRIGLAVPEQRQHGEPVPTPFGHGEVVVERDRPVGLHDHPGRRPAPT